MNNLEKDLTKKQNQVPALRFQGFGEGWKHDLLGNRVEFFSGLTYSPSDVVKRNGTLVLRSSNIQDGEVVNADNVYVNSDVVNSKNVDVGDIAVVVRNGSRHLIGKHAMVTEEMQNTVIGAFMTGVISETPNFTNALLNTNQFKKEIDKNLGATINQITTGSFRNMEFYFTSKDESLKIGTFFKQLDTNLTQHKTQLEKLKNLKQAMLQKMFPQNGAPLPEIRFKGFSENWKAQNLEAITSPVSNNSLSRAKLNYKFGTAKNIHYGDILVRFDAVLDANRQDLPFITEQSDVDKLVGAALQVGDIVFADAAEDETVGKSVELVAASKQPVFAGLHTITFRPTYNFATGYLGYYTNSESYRKQLYPLMQGTKVLSLSRNSLKSTYISHPETLQEQQKIANYFHKLDQLITLQATQLKKLKQIKQACLEQMFV